jgi:hypothetical protein
MVLPPIGHPACVEELDTKIEAAHLAIFLHVSDQFILKAVRVIPLQRPPGCRGAGVAEYFTISIWP